MNEEKLLKLKNILGVMERVAIAFSGGVDSAFLAWAARETLGEKALAFVGVSPSLPACELDGARSIAKSIGIKLVEMETHEFDLLDYRKNAPDRCYHCKTELFKRIREECEKRNIAFVADGFNTDDVDDYRPGVRAASELGIRHPLKEAGLGKAEIRKLSKEAGLSTWDKPALACLSSRVPYGTEISVEVLLRIERVEDALKQLGFIQVRARFHDPVLRIETAENEIDRFFDPKIRKLVTEAGKSEGFKFITLDLDGYRTGSLNEILNRD